MPGPFDVQVVAEVEGGGDAASFELVHDRAVINSVDGDAAAILFVVQAAALFANRSNADGAHPEHALGDDEIGQGLLMPRIDFKQDHVFRMVAAQDGAAQQLLVASQIQTAQQVAHAGVDPVGIDIYLRQNRL